MERFDVNNLRVASPCPMSWNSMTGDERSRHCERCDLNVYNVAGMTRDEVVRLVGESNGRLCMRLVRRADGTLMTKDCPVGVRAYRMRVAGFASAALAAVLGLFSISYGQKDEAAKTIKAAEVKVVTLVDHSKKSVLRGTVMDVNGAVIPDVKILLYQSDDKVTTTSSDNEGVFAFGELAAGTYRAEFRSNIGFQTLIVNDLELGRGEQKELTLYLDVGPGVEVVGELDIVPVFVIPEPEKASAPIPISPRPTKRPD